MFEVKLYMQVRLLCGSVFPMVISSSILQPIPHGRHQQQHNTLPPEQSSWLQFISCLQDIVVCEDNAALSTRRWEREKLECIE